MVGWHQERLIEERIVRGGSARPSSMKASHKKHRPHINVGKDAEEEDVVVVVIFVVAVVATPLLHPCCVVLAP